MKFINSRLIIIAVILLGSFSARSQETDINVIDEVIAQVNDSVITLSQVNREMKNAIDSFVAQGKSQKEAKTLVENRKGQMIANLINEELVMQRGKELGINVNERVNQEFVRRMEQLKLKTIDELYKMMRQQNLNPEEIRKGWTKRFTIDTVWNSQVDQQVYWKSTDKEIREYFNKNQKKFFKPATITISEIFLSFAGRNQNAVRAKAKQIVAQLRKGGDFTQAVLDNSDRPDAATKKGKAGTFDVPTLDVKFAKPLEKLKVGEISDPIEMDIGIEIIKVDARTKAVNSANFNEDLVRRAILTEKLPEARKKFMRGLKDDAYVKIRKSYQALVNPYLKDDDKKETATASK